MCSRGGIVREAECCSAVSGRMAESKGNKGRVTCVKCDNRHVAASPSVVNSCGVCYYHTECFRTVAHCECGFPTSKLLTIGEQCLACRRPTSTKIGLKMFCALHEREAVDQLYLYGRRGINCDEKARTGCTPLHVFHGNGLLNPKIAGETSRAIALDFARAVAKADQTRFCMHHETMYTIPGRIFLVVSAPARDTAHNVLSIATELFGEANARAAIAQFKKEFPKYFVQPDGTIKSAKTSFGVESILDDDSLVAFLVRFPNKAHAIAPLISQYPGAAKKVCELLDSNKAVLVQSTGLIYTGECKSKLPAFAETWATL